MDRLAYSQPDIREMFDLHGQDSFQVGVDMHLTLSKGYRQLHFNSLVCMQRMQLSQAFVPGLGAVKKLCMAKVLAGLRSTPRTREA